MRKKLVAALLCAFFPAVFHVLFVTGLMDKIPSLLADVVAFLVYFGWMLAVVSILYKDTPVEMPPPVESSSPASVPDPPPAGEGAGKRGYELFRRVVHYMEDQKPYLDDKLNLESFSRAIFSNKVYVSKNINYYSGRNFRQFVNWYRIQYALELMKTDPHLRMEEVSMLSGFHSTVSFNMAFRLFEGRTPTEWHEEYVDSLRKR